MSNTTDTDTDIDIAGLVDWTPDVRYCRTAVGTHGQMRTMAARAHCGMGRESRTDHWVYERYAGGGAGWVVWRRAWVRRGENEQWELWVTYTEG